MHNLTPTLEALLHNGVKTIGSFEPDKVLPFIEEQLTSQEYETGYAFLSWVADNNKTFGWNLPEVFNEFAAACVD
jgi:hypothetical protein